MLTQDEFDRKSYRKAILETEVQGTTPERKREIEAELVQLNADLQAHAREKTADTQQAQRASTDELSAT